MIELAPMNATVITVVSSISLALRIFPVLRLSSARVN